MPISLMNHYTLLPKRFLAHNHLQAPIAHTRRFWPIRSRFLSYCAISGLQILQSADGKNLEEDKVRILMQKMELMGISYDDSCIPGNYCLLLCPKCKGGKSIERSLSLHIIQDSEFAMWRCYRLCCGWAGQAFADSRVTNEGMNKNFKVNPSRQTTTEGVVLEPLDEKLIAYFADRMISEETLRRNSVMRIAGNQASIAFTYRQNGVLVGCKYRTIQKKFWQDKGTEKWLYGLDDIKEATEIIVVEGELDKLSVEEAGFFNCVSVPSGAPQIVSERDLPSLENLGQSISVSVELQRVFG